jgi:hypothetical protein
MSRSEGREKLPPFLPAVRRLSPASVGGYARAATRGNTDARSGGPWAVEWSTRAPVVRRDYASSVSEKTRHESLCRSDDDSHWMWPFAPSPRGWHTSVEGPVGSVPPGLRSRD